MCGTLISMLLCFSQADKMAEKEFKSKYPSFGNRPSGMAKRKISAAVSGCHLILKYSTLCLLINRAICSSFSCELIARILPCT